MDVADVTSEMDDMSLETYLASTSSHPEPKTEIEHYLEDSENGEEQQMSLSEYLGNDSAVGAGECKPSS